MEKNVQEEIREEESWEQVIETPAFDVEAEKAAQQRSRRGRWGYVITSVVLCAMAVLVYFTDTLAGEATGQLIERHKSGVGMLTTDAAATQTFRAEKEGLYTVDVMVSNYNKKVKEGTLTLWLTDEAGAEIARADFPVTEVKNNAFVTLTLPAAQSGSAGQVYTLHATSDCVEQKGVTVRMGPLESPVEGQVLTLADGTVDSENAMNLRMNYQTVSYSTMGAAALGLMALALIAVVPLGSRKERRRG